MPDPLKHVKAGDPLSAAAWNALADGVRASNERVAKLARQPGEVPLFWQRSVVQVKNGSPADRARFDVLGLNGSLFALGDNTFKEFPRFIGTTPIKGTHDAKFAILLEGISHLAIARACVSGVTVARIDMVEEWHRWADVKDQECNHLESRPGPSGAEILTVETGKGVKWALVRIGPPQPDGFWAKITAVAWLTAGRYQYTFAEVEKTGALHDGWTVKSGGRSGFAYNSIEKVGTAAEIEPARVGEIVRVREEPYSDGGGTKQTEYWLRYEERSITTTTTSTTAGPEMIDVVLCGMYNYCGEHIMFPQKHLLIPAGLGIQITDIAPTLVPLHESQGCLDCDQCEEGTTPTSLRVTLANIANKFCQNCGEFNGDFILTRPDPDLPCYYRYDFAPSPCSDTGDCVFASLFADSVEVALTIGPNSVSWSAPTPAPPFDCLTLDLDLSLDFENPNLVCWEKWWSEEEHRWITATCHVDVP